ncbi:uncharacterized protein LOC115960261 [Quercus lobata]|uniref:uncharacterized protein LOC115960261 n=1 Tax=Quercus lobata TaxID=97700 RepID=UPI001246AA86|nr:uncharacterized protein LOC115960261 [Quercus lobata]
MVVKSLNDGVVVNKFKFMMRAKNCPFFNVTCIHVLSIQIRIGQYLHVFPFSQLEVFAENHHLKPQLCHQKVDSSLTLTGMWNCECAVRPPRSKRAAIPEEGTARAIFPFDLTVAKIVL